MDHVMNSAVDMVHRLASTIPTPSKEHSIFDLPLLLSDIMTKLSTAELLTDLLVLTIVVVLALELLSNLVYHLPKGFSVSIPVRGKHLDNLSRKDYFFITVNKCMTGLFVYFYFGYLWGVRKVGKEHHHGDDVHEHGAHFGESPCCQGGQGIWALEDISLSNTLLPIPFLFIAYDFFYTLLHWFLHMKSIYAYVHKHHHHQKAPSRANIDAVNVHPLEFFLGEFNHILALHLVVKGTPLLGFSGMDVSWAGAVAFIGLGGVLAGLNHTRHDVVARVPSGGLNKTGWTFFDSKHHDVHHRIPQSNYGQYTVMWDRIFGTFREYDQNDRINPAYQLDPSTGKAMKPSKKE